MKRNTWACGMVLAALVALGAPGCKKSEPKVTTPVIGGVAVDVPKLQAAFQGGTNREIQKLVYKVTAGIRYSRPMDCMEALDKLSNDPGITEAQKKVVTEVIEQVKQLLDKQAGPAQ